MVGYRLDETSTSEFSNRTASERAIDLELFNHVIYGDGLHLLGNFLDHLIEESLVVNDEVVFLVSDLALGPLL